MMKLSDWSGILVYIEIQNKIVHPVGIELLSEAHRLAQKSCEKVYALAIGSQVESVKEQLWGYPVEEVFLYEIEGEFQPDIYEEPVEECIRKLRPSIVLIGGTAQGRALASRIAVEFRTGVTADCTKLQINEKNQLVQIRPAFGGNIMASILTENTRPQLATVRQKIFLPMIRNEFYHTVFHFQKISSVKKKIKILEIQEVNEEGSIAEQDVLVVAGRGVKKREDLEMLRELAVCLGGKLASSRALVEKGFLSAKEQVGLSGISVAPKCMITCGVSGTVQFQAGMKTTKNIVAINTDPNARIFEIAHYPICADLYEVVPELLHLLKTPQ
ncbi:MAG: electron transfer flavoprotein subunit alpha/FixB family protein [Lachnospiraceae bacterium]